MPKPRAELSPHAPRVAFLKIGTHRIRDLIGSGGRVIQALQADTQTKVDVSDDAQVERAFADLGEKVDGIDFLRWVRGDHAEQHEPCAERPAESGQGRHRAPGPQAREGGLGDGPERAYVLTQLTGPVADGDRVVVNTTAVELGLGTGGWHFVHWNLERDAWREEGPGHIMKMRYTSLQADTGSAVVFASSELEEVLLLADRILVMHEGAIAGELAAHEATEVAIMHLATGGDGKAP